MRKVTCYPICLLPLCLLFSASLDAQLEIYPYVGIMNEANAFVDQSPSDAATVYGNDRKYAAGADVLFGSRQLAPLAGILWMHRRYSAGPDSFADNRLMFPLGLAYRLRHPSTSLNVVITAAGVPAFSLSDDDTPISEARKGIGWGGRGGIVLTFDFITAGFYYYRNFGDTPIDESQRGSLIFTLGGRF